MEHYVTPMLYAAAGAVVTFLVKHYFARLNQDIARLSNSLAKIDGRLESLQTDIRANTTESAVARKEFEAVWRTLDGSRRRTSDQFKDANGG